MLKCKSKVPKAIKEKLEKDRKWYKSKGFYLYLLNIKVQNKNTLASYYEHPIKHKRLMRNWESEHKEERNKYKAEWRRLHKNKHK